MTGPILIKFPHVTAPGTPKGQAADRFKQIVEERLAGRVVVEVYPSGQLMSDDDSLDALAFGEVQMIAISLSKLDRLTHKFQVFDLPFLFPDLATIERFQASAEGMSLLDSMSDKGLQGLSFWHNGMKQFGGPVADAQSRSSARTEVSSHGIRRTAGAGAADRRKSSENGFGRYIKRCRQARSMRKKTPGPIFTHRSSTRCRTT